MRLKGILFLAGFTPRSQVYAQALTQASLYPEEVILFGPKSARLPGQVDSISSADLSSDLFMPDFSESLEKTINKWDADVYELKVQDVNDVLIYEQVKKLESELIIYSGYGAQLLRKKILGLGIPFLHMHSGWLPDYRGSTTLYYSWLRENLCAVTAIILSEGIDTGIIVGRKNYPPPPRGVDPDYVYDTVIRADWLVSVLTEYVNNKGFKEIVQEEDKGQVYYVIHPVLKHLACFRSTESCGVDIDN